MARLTSSLSSIFSFTLIWILTLSNLDQSLVFASPASIQEKAPTAFTPVSTVATPTVPKPHKQTPHINPFLFQAIGCIANHKSYKACAKTHKGKIEDKRGYEEDSLVARATTDPYLNILKPTVTGISTTSNPHSPPSPTPTVSATSSIRSVPTEAPSSHSSSLVAPSASSIANAAAAPSSDILSALISQLERLAKGKSSSASSSSQDLLKDSPLFKAIPHIGHIGRIGTVTNSHVSMHHRSLSSSGKNLVGHGRFTISPSERRSLAASFKAKREQLAFEKYRIARNFERSRQLEARFGGRIRER